MNYFDFFRRYPAFIGYGFALKFASSSGQTFFIALSGPAICRELELSDTAYGFLYSIATLSSACLLPVVGQRIDHVRLRSYTLFVCIGIVVACAAMATAHSVWLLLPALLLMRLFGQGLLGHTAATSMSRFFTRNRGKAISLSSLGYPVGEAILPMVIVLAHAGIGWRNTWWATAAVLAFGLLPLSMSLLSRHDATAADGDESSTAESRPTIAEQDGSTLPAAGGEQWTGRRVLRDLRFYAVLPAVLAPPFIGTAVFFHHDWLCKSKEWSTELWAAAFVAYAASSVTMSLVTGPLVDRFQGRRLIMVFLLPQTLGLLSLLFADHPSLAFVYMVGAGATAGAASPAIGAMWAEVYGVTHLGAIRSMVTALMVFSTACAPGPIGWLLEGGVQVSTLVATAAGLCGVASVMAAGPLFFRSSHSH